MCSVKPCVSASSSSGARAPDASGDAPALPPSPPSSDSVRGEAPAAATPSKARQSTVVGLATALPLLLAVLNARAPAPLLPSAPAAPTPARLGDSVSAMPPSRTSNPKSMAHARARGANLEEGENLRGREARPLLPRQKLKHFRAGSPPRVLRVSLCGAAAAMLSALRRAGAESVRAARRAASRQRATPL
jgi:hypothetical protein